MKLTLGSDFPYLYAAQRYIETEQPRHLAGGLPVKRFFDLSSTTLLLAIALIARDGAVPATSG
ncbi:MAG: hypothetical protein F6K09_11250, partial [Merismopedia sp. SIO2A8]|nr:hypothetical protein [Merismopedia sp. SIO2A8]